MTILHDLPSSPLSAGMDCEAAPNALVVDDSRLQRRILSASLSKWGFEVIEAGSGAEALEICATRLPDLILSDWMMPGMTGLELCRALRRITADRYVYFILLTSKTDKDEIALGLKEGADDFLSKPVHSQELHARITAGRRLQRVERELSEKNRLIAQTLTEVQALHAALDRDLAGARKLQLSLVPRVTRLFPSGQLSFLLQPSGHVGGDLVGWFPAGEGRIGLYSLDVSGHGTASALITARLSGWLSGPTPDQNLALRWNDNDVAMRPPDEVFASMNRLFQQELETEHYFTMALAEVDLTSGRLTLAQAGHPHPMIQRANGRIELLGQGGLPIGLIPDAQYDGFNARLGPGDRLLLYSDGITECPNAADGLLDEEGLAALLGKHRRERGTRLLAALEWELGALVEDGDFPDDLSAALFEYNGVN